MDHEALSHRFSYHPPQTPETVSAHEQVRAFCDYTAAQFNVILPEGREKSLAMTKLEEAMFWANAAIARDVTIVRNTSANAMIIDDEMRDGDYRTGPGPEAEPEPDQQ